MVLDIEGSVLAPAADIVHILHSSGVLDALVGTRLFRDHNASQLDLVLTRLGLRGNCMAFCKWGASCMSNLSPCMTECTLEFVY